MPRRRTPRRPRNVDATPEEVDIEAGFAELFPQVDLERLFAEPADKELTRAFDALLVKKLLVRAAVLAEKGGKDGGVSLFWLQKVPALVKLDAEITGTLGERVVEVPENPVARAAQLLGTDVQGFLKLFASLPELAAREERVVEGEAVDVSPGRSRKTGV